MTQFDRQSAIATVFREFPDAAREADSSMAGLLHMEMSCFARYIQRQIDAGNRVELSRCFEWLRQLMLYGDNEVQNAVGVSILEHLNTKDGKTARQWAIEAMPPVVRQAYRVLQR